MVDDFSITCSKCCEGILVNIPSDGVSNCVECDNKEGYKLLVCNKCLVRGRLCHECYVNLLKTFRKNKQQLRKEKSVDKANSIKKNSHSFKIFIGIALVVFCFPIYKYLSSSLATTLNSVENLKQNYPSQKHDTWYHILSVLETEFPTVKTLILLHGNNKKTLDCLTSELVSIYSKNKIKKEDITFNIFKNNLQDYGEVLEYYRPIVKKHRVILTDLNKVPADIARIFHSLCDEVSSDIKPSFFIFTLQQERGMDHLKPIERATTLLKRAWSELPDSDMFPLLSRVVRNVVEVVPEQHPVC